MIRRNRRSAFLGTTPAPLARKEDDAVRHQEERCGNRLREENPEDVREGEPEDPDRDRRDDDEPREALGVGFDVAPEDAAKETCDQSEPLFRVEAQQHDRRSPVVSQRRRRGRGSL